MCISIYPFIYRCLHIHMHVYVNIGISGVDSQDISLIQMYDLYIVADGEDNPNDNLKDYYWFTQNRYGILIVMT